MSDIELFNYESQAIRVSVVDGEPWWVAKDVCDVLGIANPSDALRGLDEDERNTLVIAEGNRGNPNVGAVNEPGLYSLILRSRKPEAKAFKRWITHEVLPTIRRTGGYFTPDALLDLTDPDAALDKLIEVANVAKEYRAKLIAAEAKAAINAPKVEAFDIFMDADGTYSVGTVAKMLGIGQNKLFTKLRNENVFIGKGHFLNTPYQKYMKHFAVKQATIKRSTGEVQTTYTTQVQPSGVDFIARKLGLIVQESLPL